MKQKMVQLSESGFTLVELIVVFSIIAVLSAMAFTAFVSFSRQQLLSDSVSNIKTMLYTARSQSLSQANKSTQCLGGSCQCPTGQQFSGYQVVFCCSSGRGIVNGPSCPTSCISSDNAEHYELQILCSGYSYLVDKGDFPSSNITINSSSTTRSILFQPLSGLVTGAGNVIVNGYSQTKTISVSQTGVISSQ